MSGKTYLPTDKIHLGLDLQGGMHLVLEVETAKAVESTLERTVGDLKENLMDKRVRFKLRERTKERNTIFEFPDVAVARRLRKDPQERLSRTSKSRRRRWRKARGWFP